MLIGKIFSLKEKSNNSIPANLKPKSINNSLEERNKLCEIKSIEDSFNKKFKKEYTEKSSLISHSCKKTKDYSCKRQNLNKALNDDDENKELIITLPKFNLEQTSDSNQNTNNISSYKNLYSIDISNINNSNSKNIFRMSNKISLNKGIKNEKKILIGYRNDRNIFNKKNSYCNTPNNLNNFKNIGKMPLPRILSNNNLSYNNNRYSKYNLIAKTNSKSIEYSPYNNIYESENANKLNNLLRNQKKLLSFIHEFNFFKSKNRLLRKKNKITNSSLDMKKNKIYFNNIFKNFSKKKKNNENIRKESLTINKKNQIQMNKIKNKIYKLREESCKVKDDVEKTMKEIDKFLDENEDRPMKIMKFDQKKKIKNSEEKKNDRK